MQLVQSKFQLIQDRYQQCAAEEEYSQLVIITYFIFYCVMLGACFTLNPFPIIMMFSSTIQISCCFCFFKTKASQYKKFLIFFPSHKEDACFSCLDLFSYGYLGCIEGYAYGMASYFLSLVFIFALIYYLVRGKRQQILAYPLDIPQNQITITQSSFQIQQQQPVLKPQPSILPQSIQNFHQMQQPTQTQSFVQQQVVETGYVLVPVNLPNGTQAFIQQQVVQTRYVQVPVQVQNAYQ